MIGPVRALYALRPRTSPGVLFAAVAVAALFAATPFALPEVADRYDVSLGVSGLISALQVGGFAAASFLGGRVLQPTRRVLVAAAATAVLANALSAANELFVILLTLRLVAGAAAGVLVWIAWSDAMQGRGRMADVAAAGPLTVLLVAPILASVGHAGDDRAIYAVLAVIFVPPAVLPARIAAPAHERRRMSPSRSNVVLLVALGLLTASGSSLFIFVAAMGIDVIGMSPVAASIGYSLNAGAGMLGTRLRTRQGTASLWFAATGVAAVSVVLVTNEAVFYAALALWGFSFWMGVPEVFRQIAAWSLTPDERVGDAQALMAVGRAIGPVTGGTLVAHAGYVPLGITAGLGLAAVASIVAGVEAYRRSNPGANPSADVAPAG